MFFIILWVFPVMLHVWVFPVMLNAAPIPFDGNIDEMAMKKLKAWGYLQDLPEGSVSALESQDVIRKAIQRFQRIAYVPETGVIDDATRKMLQAPRCGVPDYPIADSSRRKRRFVPQGTKWNNNPVTWQLENSNGDGIPDDVIRLFLRKSFEKWSAAANIDFEEIVSDTIGTSQIRVSFGTGNHGDPFPFDGPSGTLAHAFFPLDNQGLSGDMHFDDAETYTVEDLPRNSGTIKFFWVAVHEFGHSLGLSHSDVREAIMYPFYQHFPGLDFNLTADDTAGIQAVYGPRPTTVPTTKPDVTTPVNPNPVTTTTTTKAQPSNLCTTTAKAAILWSDNTLWVFNGNVYHVISEDGAGIIETGFVKDVFSGLETVDAVHRWQVSDQFVVFFHGDSFSIFDNLKRRRSTPRKIVNGYLGLDDIGFKDIDAAVVWPKSNKLYLFKGELYYRFTQLQNGAYLLDFDYPMDIFERWIGVPNNLDSAFTWKNGKTYFFKGDLYYRFDDQIGAVRTGYPQKTISSFLECKSSLNFEVENLQSSSSSSSYSVKFSFFNLISILSFAFYYGNFSL